MTASGAAWTHRIRTDPDARDPLDFSPTPPEGTRALLKAEGFTGSILEPACGAGHLSLILRAAGHEVVSRDVCDRGYGTAGVDFLAPSYERVDNIVTNPPYRHAEAFARLATRRARRKVALLLRWNFYTAAHHGLFDTSPSPPRALNLAAIHVFAERLQIRRNGWDGDGTTMTDYAWFIWQAGHAGRPAITQIRPLYVPGDEALMPPAPRPERSG